MTDNYDENDEKEIRQDIGIGMAIRNPKLITTSMLRSKLNTVLSEAVDVLKNSMQSDDAKLKYKAAMDVLAFHISLAKLEMQEETHREQIKFHRFKNRQNKRLEEIQKIQGDIQEGGGTAHIPESEFSEDFDAWGNS